MLQDQPGDPSPGPAECTICDLGIIIMWLALTAYQGVLSVELASQMMVLQPVLQTKPEFAGALCSSKASTFGAQASFHAAPAGLKTHTGAACP